MTSPQYEVIQQCLFCGCSNLSCWCLCNRPPHLLTLLTPVIFSRVIPDYSAALKGVKTVFCTIPHINNWSEAFPAFLSKAKEKKVEHFVKISFLRQTDSYKGMGDIAQMYRHNVPFVAFHQTCDDILEQAKYDSRISYTILATSHLMTTPLLHQGEQLIKDSTFTTASYGMGVNYVSPNDVADAAVVVLLNPKVG